MTDINYEKLLPPLISGDALIRAVSYYPDYDKKIIDAEPYERLERLTDIYRLYYPFPMAIEIYSKLYLATVYSLKKKNTKLAVQQRNMTYRSMTGDKQYKGIIGGMDSLTIIGLSGIGKSSAVQTALSLISGGLIIEADNPYIKIIPCLQVQCPYDASPKGLLLEILRSVDEAIDTKYHERSRKASDTTDVLIGTVSQVCLNHVGLLVIDEIQNVSGRKSGSSLMSMIIQLINSSGISICMVGTPECIPFFESSMQLSRRSSGLKYGILPYDRYFEDFCRKVWQYQYVKEAVPIDTGLMEWLYQHSGGIVANVVSLIHDAQEMAILSGAERLDRYALERAYTGRMAFMHRFVGEIEKVNHPKVKKSEMKIKEPEQAIAIEEYQAIEEIVEAAKKRGVDQLEYLSEHIHIEEVPV